MRLAVFGLPLAGLLLAADGHEIALAAVAPAPAPGRRRLQRVARAYFDARSADATALDAAISAVLVRHPPDLLVSWFWTRRVPRPWLELCRLGGVNAHPSLLPRHRGPDPFFWAIDSGDACSGVTIHEMDESYDSGRILCQESLVIGQRNAWQLARALDRPSLRLLRRVVSDLDRGAPLDRRPQAPARATWAPTPTGALLRCDWCGPTAKVLRRIRALAPQPGVAIEIRGRKLFVLEASLVVDFPEILRPGEAAAQGAGERRVVIRCEDGAVGIDRALVERADDCWEAVGRANLASWLWDE